MSKSIVEGQEKMADAAASLEKKARQLVYDARYEVKNELQGKKVAPAVVERMVLQRIAKSTAIPAVKARAKQMISKKPVKEEFILNTENTASESVANAMFKVFVEGVQEEETINLVYEEEMRAAKYHIRVTDPKTGRTYTRKADREKITQLRAKGLKVEMSEYRDSTEARKEQEKGAKKRAKKDYDGDGKVESSSKEHAGVVHNAIQRSRGGNPDGQDTRKEDYLWSEAVGGTGTTSVEGQNAKKIDVMKSGEQNAVKVFPEIKEELIAEKAMSKAQQRFMGMVYARKKGKMKKGEASPEVEAAAKGMSKKEAKKFAKTKHKGLPEKKSMSEAVVGGSAPQVPAPVAKFVDELPQRAQQILRNIKGSSSTAKPAKKKVNEEAACPKCGKSPCECDTRANKVYRDLLKAKFRAMGKNPIAMMGDDENLEKSYNDMMTASFIKTDETGKVKPVSLYSEQQKAPHGWKPYGGRPKPGDNSEGSTEVDATRNRIEDIRKSIKIKKA